MRRGTVVQHDRVEDVGHDWPGGASLRPFSATVATWQFLSASASRRPTPDRGEAGPAVLTPAAAAAWPAAHRRARIQTRTGSPPNARRTSEPTW
jgi:hypothetical protein